MVKNENPLVSIIVPVYNGEKNVYDTLLSILNQTYKNIEVIVVDDGSKDGTLEVIGKLPFNNRLKVIKQAHSGVAIARNTGMDNSKGDFISYIDSDDFISKDYVANLMVPFFEEQGKKIIMSVGKFVTVTKFQNLFTNGHRIVRKGPSQALRQMLMQEDGTDVSLSSRIYRASSLKKLKMNLDIVFEDLDFNVRFLASQNENTAIAFIDSIVLEYYQRPGSIMHRGFTEEEMTILKVIDNTLKAVKHSDKNVQKALKNKLISALSGVYARSILDGASKKNQQKLYHNLVNLSENFSLKKPITKKTFFIVIVLKLGRVPSRFLLSRAYKLIKKI